MRRARALRSAAAIAAVALLAAVPASSALLQAPLRRATAGDPVAMPATWATGRVVAAAAKDGAILPSFSGAGPGAGGNAVVPTPAFDGPATGLVPPPSTLEGAPEDGVWAVIVGIDDYPGSKSDLRASVNDADATEAALAAYGIPASRMLVLRNGQASGAAIRAALGWLVRRASTNATAVFFYAGHIRKLTEGKEAIVAADGRLVTDADVTWDLKHLQARRTWIVLAACYAGGFTEVLAPGRILTGAADSSSLAYESATYNRSYLAEFMIQRAMRNGWAADSIERAFAWAQDELRRQHPGRVLVQYDMADGDVVLGPPPPPQPQPTAGAAPPDPEPPQPAPQPEPPPPPPPAEPADDQSCLLGVLGECD